MSSSSNSRNATRRHTFWFRNPAHEEIAFAHEEKQNAREEIAFPHEADPIDAVMARRFGAPSRCAKLHSR